MADIISLETKFKLSDAKREKKDRQHKLEIVQKILPSPQNAVNCERCGTQQTQTGNTIQHHLRVPYNFCPDCSEEYIDYIEQLKGNSTPEKYWQNVEWQRAWRAWIDYRNRVDQFLKSKEFKKLIQEILT